MLTSLQDVLKDEPYERSYELTLPPEIMLASKLFPFAPPALCNPTTFTLLACHLPRYDRATYLIESYFRDHTHHMAPVTYNQAEDLLNRFYPGRSPISAHQLRAGDLHELALFFILMSNGYIGDFNRPVDNPEPLMFMHLCRASLGLHSIFSHGTVASVQAIFEMVSFSTQRLRLVHDDSAWTVMDLGFIIAMSVCFTLSFQFTNYVYEPLQIGLRQFSVLVASRF